MRFATFVMIMFVVSCKDTQPSSIHKSNSQKHQITATELPQRDTIFKYIEDYPFVKDSSSFISGLLSLSGNDVSDFTRSHGYVTAFQRVDLYGYLGDLYFIEFDYGGGPGAAFPWKFQLLFNGQGHFLGRFDGLSYRFITVLKGNPFLLITGCTSKGNGWHELYKINSAGKVENVYDATLRTYDKHEDAAIYSPNELELTVNDDNKDGYNDLIFTGTQHYIMGKSPDGFWYDTLRTDKGTINYSVDNPFKKVPIKLVFLFDQVSGHFKEKENYEKKYNLYN